MIKFYFLANETRKKTAIIIFLILLIFLIDSFISFLSTFFFGNGTDWTDTLKVSRSMLNASLMLLIYGVGLYYISDRNIRFPHFNVALRQSTIGIGLGMAIGIGCLLLSPALYYTGSVFQSQPPRDIAFLFIVFLSGAVMEEVLYRGCLQLFLCRFLPVPLATFIQVFLFVYAHEVEFSDTTNQWLRITNLAMAGLLFTLLAKRSPYLILPIFFHATSNFSISLARGKSEIPLNLHYEIWNFGSTLAIEYKPLILGIYCLAFLYLFGWSGQGKKSIIQT